MSGIVGLFAPPGGTVDHEAFRRSLAALSHHGRHGSVAEERASWALGRQVFETPATAHPGGRGGPSLAAPGRHPRVHVAHDGRLDNRRDLCGQLGLVPSLAPDAEILVRAWEAWGEGMFERIVGPLALLLVDERTRRVVAGRDALGDRLLVYRRLPDGSLLAASEEQALLAPESEAAALDETAIAHFLAIRPLPPDRTFFRDVRALPAGHALTWSDGASTLRRHWTPPLEDRFDPRTDGEWIEEAGYRFREAVRCRVPSPGRVAVLMSGGLDSTSIAAEAAELTRPTTISWVFEELAAADERPWIEAMSGSFDLRSIRIPADGLWPLAESPGRPWPVSPNLPAQTIYRRLLEASYARAREAGASVLLSGDYADQLYVGSRAWLRELLRQGRWLTAAWRGLGEAAAPRAAKLGLRSAIGGLLRRSGVPSEPPEWLTDDAVGLLEESSGVPRANRPDQLAAITAGWALPYENAEAARAGIEIRRPFRDRRLVELFLRMPAHVQYRPGWRKWGTRQMMNGRLPDPVRRRRRGTTMLPLAQRGLVEREIDTVRHGLSGPGTLWPRYVRRDWIREHFPADLADGRDGASSLVPWNCLCLELWLARREAVEAAA